ncbi:hypothetical protein F8388_000755 [Cannabis sativa]|uniref:Reverse transcriptase zinc-binding domain-containing protein n=1 Tax=Cannabis sativa TaxID=3483 RepID=A0A7J6ECZ3_CANSA|nr:hypothetical protein F8388_000755 [Cannabis sativa]
MASSSSIGRGMEGQGNASTQRRQSTFGAQWLRSGAVTREEADQNLHAINSNRNAIPGNQELMGELVGRLHVSDTPNKKAQNEDINMVNENNSKNDQILNVTKKGSFFNSTLTTVFDSKRRRPGIEVDFTDSLENEASPIPVVPGLENFNVNSLFQIHSRNWDVEVVRDLFSPVDAAIILGIQINQSTEDDYCTFWKKLWSLKVSPKAKDLMWRAVSNCLATRVNLCIKKVLTDSACPLCGIYAETEIHLFVTCQFASSCWEEAAVADASRNNNSFLQWMSFNAHSKDNDKLSRIVMLCWALWSARNDLIWKDRVRNVSDVVAFAFSSLDQYVKAQGKGNIPSQSPLKDGDGSELWKKPLSGIKLNVDAAIFDRDSKHGFGCVGRTTLLTMKEQSNELIMKSSQDVALPIQMIPET